MSNISLTDFAYQAIERAEQKRTRLMYIVIGCLLTSLPGLGINAYFFMALSHEKGGLSGSDFGMISILAIACLLLLAIGLYKLFLLRNLGNKLNQFELLEETIYSEVLKPGQVG
jgi:hypothetical protein